MKGVSDIRIVLVTIEGSKSPRGTLTFDENTKKAFRHTLWRYEINHMGYLVREEFISGNQVAPKDAINILQFNELIMRGITKLDEPRPRTKIRMDFTLPAILIEKVAEKARQDGKSKSEIVARCIESCLE